PAGPGGPAGPMPDLRQTASESAHRPGLRGLAGVGPASAASGALAAGDVRGVLQGGDHRRVDILGAGDPLAGVVVRLAGTVPPRKALCLYPVARLAAADGAERGVSVLRGPAAVAANADSLRAG